MPLTLPDAGAVRFAARLRHIVDQVEHQQRFDPADGGEDGAGGKHDLQHLPVEWHVGQVELRQTARDGSYAVHRPGVYAGEDHQHDGKTAEDFGLGFRGIPDVQGVAQK